MNHIIVLSNVFGTEAVKFYCFKIGQEHWSVLKTFLVFLNYMIDSGRNKFIDTKLMSTLRINRTNRRSNISFLKLLVIHLIKLKHLN